MKIKKDSGFTLVEAIVVIGVVAILAVVAIPGLTQYKKTYEFNGDASQMEYLVKNAKVAAMERTVNVGICVSSGALTTRDIGKSRTANNCSGAVLQTMTPHSHVTLAGSGGIVDPRGVAIQEGYVCVTYNNSFSKIHIEKSGLRTETGAGGCS